MPSSTPDPLTRTEEVIVPAESIRPAGILAVPQNPTALIVFAHGSGSGRLSPRNRFVADVLNRAGLATMLVDLLTADEEGDRTLVFDIELLAHRLVEVTRWLRTRSALSGLPTGYFGASTGAGAALWAATEPGTEIAAVVSRGGRPDLAGPRLALVRAPTLLIVGGNDQVVLDLNHRAQAELHCENDLTVVPGASHLFEEPGTLDAAAALARDWFKSHLARGYSSARM
jgi:dienelactone hydrolase